MTTETVMLAIFGTGACSISTKHAPSSLTHLFNYAFTILSINVNKENFQMHKNSKNNKSTEYLERPFWHPSDKLMPKNN